MNSLESLPWFHCEFPSANSNESERATNTDKKNQDLWSQWKATYAHLNDCLWWKSNYPWTISAIVDTVFLPTFCKRGISYSIKPCRIFLSTYPTPLELLLSIKYFEAKTVQNWTLSNMKEMPDVIKKKKNQPQMSHDVMLSTREPASTS